MDSPNSRTTTTTTTNTAKPCATSPSASLSAATLEAPSIFQNVVSGMGVVNFLPDYTEHPKPKRRKSVYMEPEPTPVDDDDEVTFFQDFLAGGAAGSASVIVGHPLDTIKVRVQNSSTGGIMSSIRDFGGVSSLFRGMGAPLGTAAVINAVVFGSYGYSSRLYDTYITDPESETRDYNHDPPQKAATCGAIAGLAQCLIICPMEHVKCRLQVQAFGNAANFKGPVSATRGILANHGVTGLYRGWWCTSVREVPAFAMYFAVYDFMKDRVNTYLAKQAGVDPRESFNATTSGDFSSTHTHTWIASAIAGGIAGSSTWLIVYPVDVIKTRVQTMPLNTPRSQLTMYNVASQIVAKHGWRHLFRGLNITLIRAFPVNGTIFPIYEFTLMQVRSWGNNN